MRNLFNPKRVITALLSLVFVITLALPVSAEKKKSEVKKVTFITSIDCDHCKKTIMNAIPFEKGVKDVQVDIPTKEVTVTFKSDKSSVCAIQKAIEELEYTAKVKPECCKDSKCTDCKDSKCTDAKCTDCKDSKCKDAKCSDCKESKKK